MMHETSGVVLRSFTRHLQSMAGAMVPHRSPACSWEGYSKRAPPHGAWTTLIDPTRVHIGSADRANPSGERGDQDGTP